MTAEKHIASGYTDGAKPITYGSSHEPTSKQAALIGLGKTLDVFIARKTKRGDYLDLLIRGHAVSPTKPTPSQS
jgi:hypothetical protein